MLFALYTRFSFQRRECRQSQIYNSTRRYSGAISTLHIAADKIKRDFCGSDFGSTKDAQRQLTDTVRAKSGTIADVVGVGVPYLLFSRENTAFRRHGTYIHRQPQTANATISHRGKIENRGLRCIARFYKPTWFVIRHTILPLNYSVNHGGGSLWNSKIKSDFLI